MSEMRDYRRWHDAYDDPASDLSQRLTVVRASINATLDDRPHRPVSVLSLCAGDGRDVFGALAGRDDATRIAVTLVEIDAELAERARRAAADQPAAVDVRTADAGHTAALVGAVPADLLLLVGIFGNIAAEDIERTVATCPQWCAPGATVIWSRGDMDPDLRPAIRDWFEAAGFANGPLVAPATAGYGVGVATLQIPPSPFEPDRDLFTFLR